MPRRDAHYCAVNLPVDDLLAELKDDAMKVLFLKLKSHLDFKAPFTERRKTIRCKKDLTHFVCVFSRYLL